MAGIPEYERLDAIGLATLIARREVTALEVLEETIAQAEKFNTAINAVILKLYDQARAVAKAPLPEGPLAGVPFLLKDLGVLMAARPAASSRSPSSSRSASTAMAGARSSAWISVPPRPRHSGPSSCASSLAVACAV
jgi:Asp-tRNA(Asn)/Glu-tRNA(Gln) amidotransferase A subunit family amidase